MICSSVNRDRFILSVPSLGRTLAIPGGVSGGHVIFSHVPNFSGLLRTAATNLKPSGELFIETGNLADLERRNCFQGILDLPDHLVFAGESQMARLLEQAGFHVVETERHRVDGLMSFVKDLAKALLGRPVLLRPPYSSAYRQLMIRARLTAPRA